MIESSFCVLSGVGPKTERRLWQRGVGTWTEFLSSDTVPGIGPSRKEVYDAELTHAQAHLAQEDARYFGMKLPASEHWRLYEWLRPRGVYLDIETNSFGQITVVGLYGHGDFTSLVEGESLTRQRLCEEIAQYDLLVTFNGTSFDLPVLLASIQGLPLDQPHVDLCLLGRQLGYRGGLKAIEHQLGIRRRADLCGMSGADAGQLWNRWRHSRDEKHGDGPWPITRQTVSTYNHWQICSIAESFDSVEVMMPHPATRPTVWRLAHPLTGMESPHVTTRAGEEEG